MAKRQRKQQKHLPRPPLSRWDKVFYPAVVAGGIVIAVGMALGGSILTGCIARTDPTVLLTRSTLYPLTLVLAVVFILFVMIPLLWWGKLKGVIPIFARRDVIYGQIGGYRESYPVFGRYRIGYGADDWAENTREKKQLLRCLAIALVILLLFPLTLFGRYDLHEDMSLTVRSIVNTETTRYDPEDVTSVILAIEYNVTARRSGYNRYHTTVTVKTSDGMSYKFSADPETMAAVTARISPSKIRRQTDISVADYIERRNLNEEDAAILRGIFLIP